MFSELKAIYRLYTDLFPRNITKKPCFQRLSFSTSENVEGTCARSIHLRMQSRQCSILVYHNLFLIHGIRFPVS